MMKDLKRVLISLLLSGSIILFFTAFNYKPKPSGGFKVVGYLFNKRVDMDKIPYQYLTHINYSFGLPAPDSSGNVLPVAFPEQLRKLVKNAHSHGVKVLISIGGWELGDGGGNDTRFEVLASHSSTRTAFTTSAMNIVREFNLDGVDIDWEYPDPIEPSSSNYVLLMKQLSDSLHASGKKLSAAIVSFNDQYGYGITKGVFPYVDWMNIMAYDYEDGQYTPHSPYWLAVRSFDYWVGDRGLPAKKAVMGVNIGFYKYLLRRGANPYYDLHDSIYYNGITTIKKKTELALKRGAGIMIWEITSDTTGQYSLLKAIHDVAIRKK